MSTGFMFYENFINALDMLPEGEREKACYEFCRFGITGVLPEDRNLAMFCVGVSASVRKYSGRGGARENAGRKSKESNIDFDLIKNQNNQNNQNNHNEQTETKTETETKTQDTYTDFSDKSSKSGMCVTDTPKIQKFIPPTVGEVSAYCRERGSNVDAERFVDFYTSNGWKVGKNPMKDWRAAVRTWERSSVTLGGKYSDNAEDDAKWKKLFEGDKQ